ncbi:DUF1963 domain-containing protein [Gemmata sp.]|uniref:DUF1963 domain-containing protein n=1 Tax=Gemmata sp. TaxID=1914242 RepID=UPI003F70A105
MPPKSPKPHANFPAPAAALRGEADLLAAVLADPGDDTARLVYADWLDEHDDPRGQYLRDTVAAFRNGTKLPRESRTWKAWSDLVGIDLMRRLWQQTPTEFSQTVLGLARPAVNFVAKRTAEAKIPVGASKFGGGPDLPAGAKWPVYRGAPLSFLAQINLAELAPSPACRELPSSGVLSVFCYYDPDEGNDAFPKGSWKLLHFPDASKLTRNLPPEVSFSPCRLVFTECLTVPDPDSPWNKTIGFGHHEDAEDMYREVIVGPVGGHQLLGYPVPIQCDPLDKKTVRHLLTIDADDKPDWMWGDGGALYFLITEADLKAHRFDRVRLAMQCC